MFEDSTFASTGKIRMRSRAGFVVALVFDSTAVLTLFLIPLLSPHILPRAFTSFLMNAPPAPAESPKPQPRTVAARIRSTVLKIDSFAAPRRIPKTIYYADRIEPAVAINVADFADSEATTMNGPFTSATPVAVNRTTQHPIRVSSLVVEGLLVQKTMPTYPAIALATRTQGTVVLNAKISREGIIENLRVASGSPMLQQAALAAVSNWRYRPYMLNGEPIEVETTINVVFKLNE